MNVSYSIVSVLLVSAAVLNDVIYIENPREAQETPKRGRPRLNANPKAAVCDEPKRANKKQTQNLLSAQEQGTPTPVTRKKRARGK